MAWSYTGQVIFFYHHDIVLMVPEGCGELYLDSAAALACVHHHGLSLAHVHILGVAENNRF